MKIKNTEIKNNTIISSFNKVLLNILVVLVSHDKIFTASIKLWLFYAFWPSFYPLNHRLYCSIFYVNQVDTLGHGTTITSMNKIFTVRNS